MIAGAIVAIIAVVTASYMVNLKGNSIRIEGASACRNRVADLVATFKNADNKVTVDNWHATAANPVPLPAQFNYPNNHMERFMFPMIQGAPPITWGMTNAWQLINNGTNWALALFNSNRNVCSTTGNGLQIFAGSPFYPPGAPLANNERIFLNIKRADLSANPHTVDCLGAGTNTLKIFPLGRQNGGNASAHLGMEITGTVIVPNADPVQNKQCVASVLLKPEGDSAPPTPISPPLDVGGSAGPLCNGGLCLHNSNNVFVNGNVSCNSQTMIASVAVRESGVVFACKLDYTSRTVAGAVSNATTNWVPCTAFSLNVGNPNVVGFVNRYHTQPADGSTGVRITLGFLVDGFYTFSVKAFDSAQNESIVGTVQFGIDNTRPSAIRIAAPTPLIGNIASGTVGLGHALPFGSGSNLVTIPGMFQCQDGSDNWRVVSPVGAPTDIIVSTNGGSWNVAGSTSAPGTCTDTFPNPNPLATGGPYNAQATACDQCGLGTAVSNNIQWIMDNIPLSAGHTPGNFDHQPPNFVLSTAKANVAVPYQYICENTNATFFAAGVRANSCTPTVFNHITEIPCKPGPGFCTRAYDGCGRGSSDVATTYSIFGHADPNDNCGQVACGPGYICAVDQPGDRGKCVTRVNCFDDNGCPGSHNCFGGQLRCSAGGPCQPTGANVGDPCSFPPGPPNGNWISAGCTQGTCHGPNAGPAGPTTNNTCPNLTIPCGVGASPPPIPSPGSSASASPSAAPSASASPGSSPVSPPPSPGPPVTPPASPACLADGTSCGTSSCIERGGCCYASGGLNVIWWGQVGCPANLPPPGQCGSCCNGQHRGPVTRTAQNMSLVKPEMVAMNRFEIFYRVAISRAFAFCGGVPLCDDANDDQITNTADWTCGP